MTNAALRGKPDAGNPAATPRRGSLLYNGRREFIKVGAFAALAAAGGCATQKCGVVCAGGAAKRKVGFKLGMAGYTFKEFKTDEMLDALERLDIHYLCVKNFHLPFTATDADIAEFKAKCAAKGVTPYGLGPVNTKTIDDVKRMFDFAKRLGVNVVVGVPYRRGATGKWSDQEQDRDMCEKISPLCDEYDIRFAIHNHGPDAPKCFPTGAASCEFVKDLSPRMGMCLDIGHDLRGGGDPATTIRKYHDRLFDFHLKDIIPNTDGIKATAMPLGRGVLDLPGIVEALCDVGYTGSCSIEYEKNFTDNYAELAECAGYFRALMKSAERRRA